MKADAVWIQEQDYLDEVLSEARGQLEISDATARARMAETVENKRFMSENVSKRISVDDDWSELMFHIRETHAREREVDLAQTKARRLRRILDAPYFGRIDFMEKGREAADMLYVGLAALTRRSTGEHLVLDWRAPVCSMYYDYEPGPAEYRCQAGAVSGELTLKRQYRIANGRLEGMFDSSVHIADQILQEILSRNASRHMRAIVTSIQRDQNRIIRDENHPVLIVQGPAGSGKTSIALQRAAYLLYRHRGEVQAHHIVAFSPNRLMNDYTSDVLPELGEEHIRQTTFFEYACGRLPIHSAEDPGTQMEYLLAPATGPDDFARHSAIRFKASRTFLLLLDNCLRYMAEEWAPWQGVSFWGTEAMDRDAIARLIHEEYSFLPLARRLEGVRGRIMYLIGPAIHEVIQRINQMRREEGDEADEPDAPSRKLRLQLREEVARLRREVDAWAFVEPRSLYKRLFADDELFRRASEGLTLPGEIGRIREFTLGSLESGRVLYEDLAPLLYLKGALEGIPDPRETRHVIIDEAQDYSWTQFRVFAREFPKCTLTILGDSAQAIHPVQGVGNLAAVLDEFDGFGPSYAELTKRYRSTRQIAAFSAALAKLAGAGDSVERPGDKPGVIRVANPEMMPHILAREIRDLQSRKMGTIAIVCRSGQTSSRIAEGLRPLASVQAILDDGEFLNSPVVVLPVHLAKGLEFDAVLLPDADDYGRGEERLLYTACTRALHQLRLYHENGHPELLTGVDESLYVTAAAGEWDPIGN